jgi:hypothetical protein
MDLGKSHCFSYSGYFNPVNLFNPINRVNLALYLLHLNNEENTDRSF